jgi:hypothetical protein
MHVFISNQVDFYSSVIEWSVLRRGNEITAAEDGFMRGRDMAMKEMEEARKKDRKPIIHDDGTSVTLNEEQYEED